MTDAPTPMREALIATIIETLADEHPSMTQVALARWHLPGGVTPRSSGTTIDIHGLADAIDALYRDQVERLKGELAEARAALDASFVCSGCGSSRTMADIKALGVISCCPEREMLTASELYKRLIIAEAEAEAAHEKADAEGARANSGDLAASLLGVTIERDKMGLRALAAEAKLVEVARERDSWRRCAGAENSRANALEDQRDALVEKCEPFVAMAELISSTDNDGERCTFSVRIGSLRALAATISEVRSGSQGEKDEDG